MPNQKLNRRKWLRVGLGLAVGSTTGFVPVGQINTEDCSQTPPMELGPNPPVSSQVLRMYVGNYEFNSIGTSIEGLIKGLYPKQEDVLTAEVTHEGEQLYLQFPFPPETERYGKARIISMEVSSAKWN
jgi:hypothetical protein